VYVLKVPEVNEISFYVVHVVYKCSLDTHGGALVNLIHSYTDNGDPFVRMFTDKLLEEVCVVAGIFLVTFERNRFLGHSLPPYTDGFSLGNCTIRFPNFLLRWMQTWALHPMFIPPHYWVESTRSQEMAGSQG